MQKSFLVYYMLDFDLILGYKVSFALFELTIFWCPICPTYLEIDKWMHFKIPPYK